MKLMWFHLMPYTDLPERFAEEYDSVWVDIPKSLFDPAAAHEMYNEFCDEMEFAAEVGFDAVCVNEHHANGYGLMPSPNIIAATMARRTSDCAICVMGNSLALYNPPIRVAEEFAMLDIISGGRLIAGMPVGSPMDTVYAYSQNPATLRDRYQEAHDLIVKAWKAEEPFDWNGRYTQMADVNVWQKPIQDPHPPIWIPGGSSVETWVWSAERDYLYSYLSYFGYKNAKRTMDGYWSRMADLGRDPNPFSAGFLQFVGVADSREEAFELYREPAEYFYGNCLHVGPKYSSAPGYQDEASLRARLQSQVQAAAHVAKKRREAKEEPRSGGGSAFMPSSGARMEEIVEKGYVVIGSADEVAEQLRELAHDLNVGHLMLLLQFGNMHKDLVMANTEAFAKEVAPQLRDLFEDEWENRWWPEPMADDDRVRPRAVAP